jgi:hypothetical protein
VAFDRLKPPGEAILAETPEASYSAEFGRTYVPVEDVTDFILLSGGQSALLGAWAERLIPAEGSWPSAAEVGAHMYADNCAARSPLLRSMLLRAVELIGRRAWESHGHEFDGCSEEQRDELLGALESGADSVLFDLVLELIFEGYYRADAVLAVLEDRTGFKVMAPVQGVVLEPFDEALLERVRGLPGRFKEVRA